MVIMKKVEENRYFIENLICQIRKNRVNFFLQFVSKDLI